MERGHRPATQHANPLVQQGDACDLAHAARERAAAAAQAQHHAAQHAFGRGSGAGRRRRRRRRRRACAPVGIGRTWSRYGGLLRRCQASWRALRSRRPHVGASSQSRRLRISDQASLRLTEITEFGVGRVHKLDESGSGARSLRGSREPAIASRTVSHHAGCAVSSHGPCSLLGPCLVHCTHL